jgi:hypothetical protein
VSVRPVLAFAVVLACAPATEPVLYGQARALLQSAPRPAGLELRCEPRDSEVHLDGVPQGTCADFAQNARLAIRGEGTHRVEVKKEGYVPFVSYYAPDGISGAVTITLHAAQARANEGDSR